MTRRFWAAGFVLFCILASASASVLYVDVNSTNSVAPYTNWETAASVIQDAVDDANTGDEVLVTNGVYSMGGRGAPGGAITNRVLLDKPITLKSVNGASVTFILGYQLPTNALLGGIYGEEAVRGVYLTNRAALNGFTVSNGACRFFQFLNRSDNEGGGVYCGSTNETVSNCVISGNSANNKGGGAFGGKYNNCVISNNWLGFNGDSGGGASGAILSDCTLVANSALWNGGGVSDSTLTNCLLKSNTTGHQGGGAINCHLKNCRILGNSCTNTGGGSFGSDLTHCEIIGNSAYQGGGSERDILFGCTVISNTAAFSAGGMFLSVATNCLIAGNFASVAAGAVAGTLNNCTIIGNFARDVIGGVAVYDGLNNCIVLSNSASGSNSNYQVNGPTSPIRYCCTDPLPSGSDYFFGNITDDPFFVNAAEGDFRLQSNSSCINAGKNSFALSSTDLDGSGRIAGGTVDIGAFEFQNPSSVISYAWLQQYGLPFDGSADYADPDADGMNNWQEWVADTNPTNAASAFRLLSATGVTNGTAVTWESVPTRTYFVLGGTNVAALGASNLLATNVAGGTNTTTYVDSNAIGTGPFFYRVGAQR